jgi:hypothetical protein
MYLLSLATRVFDFIHYSPHFQSFKSESFQGIRVRSARHQSSFVVLIGCFPSLWLVASFPLLGCFPSLSFVVFYHLTCSCSPSFALLLPSLLLPLSIGYACVRVLPNRLDYLCQYDVAIRCEFANTNRITLPLLSCSYTDTCSFLLCPSHILLLFPLCCVWLSN